MFFIIKYVDFQIFQNKQKREEASRDAEDKSASIRNENTTLLLNPDCPTGLMRDYICEKVRISKEHEDAFDLCTVKGKLLNLREYEGTKNGMDIFKNRETYYIALMAYEQFTILLDPSSNEFTEIMSIQQRRKSSNSKARRSVTRVSSTAVSSVDASVSTFHG